ncbi:MAG TPA: SpoIIE family protein phosphatase [Candidatus Omnitrophota bacterium]|nr:SpoIIE family protein phosphatase [Candidatus Omnitrophota bacterium]HPD84832.1 SpoIIE family protein phosphatase [Candidatus Omnitrophota bacterium]HRZ03690.1 SpoIIE family protein phosphatase [Candidatus Omnitrophota bacterium]
MERLAFSAKLENLQKMLTFIKEGASRQGFVKDQINKIQIACEEALVNVINYAYPGKDGELAVTYVNQDNCFEIEIIDSGIPFDPLSLPEPDIHAPLEERKIGGLGIFMMRKIMDEVRYRRENGKNVLTLVKFNSCMVTNIQKPAIKDLSAVQTSCRWPVDLMKQETYKKGDFLFKAGDKADRMFYIKKGAIKLVEINKFIKSGDVIGEMGIFSPFKVRTASALCEEDIEAYTMGRDEVIKFFAQDPALAIELMQLSIKRFMENLKAETEARERIESELRIAQEIQMSMLPSVFPQRKEFDIFAMMDPAKEVGGDLYDFFFVDDKHLCFVIGDVSGKGVPAALFMAISKALIKTEAKQGFSAAETLARVNNILYPDNQTCLFVTVFCVLLNIETGELQYCNAGHNPPLVIGKDGEVDFIKVPGGFVVGVMENAKCENINNKLNPGDTIFLYTDGVTEAMNLERKMFSESGLKACIMQQKDKDIKEMIGKVREEVFAFANGAPQSDDITMLAVRYKGKPKGV